VVARLHRERIAHTGARPASWLLLTHGIYGTGANLRGIARKLHEARPDWGVVLVDLRGHGRSDAGEPPHTIDACAADVAALVAELGDVTAIAGHSFGGKIALAARRLVHPRQTWVLDASPSARPGALAEPGNVVADMLALMEQLPRAWGRREDFVAAIVERGHVVGLAQWLAMNLARSGDDELVLRLDLALMRTLLESYHATDLWDALAAPDGDVEVVIAERSSTIGDAERTRVAHMPPHVHVHRIDAGHWLHVEAPQAVVDLFARVLPANSVAGDT
jgi:esterase